VRAGFDDAALVENQNLVSSRDCGETMSMNMLALGSKGKTLIILTQ
jgi:hypothetical protein